MMRLPSTVRRGTTDCLLRRAAIVGACCTAAFALSAQAGDTRVGGGGLYRGSGGRVSGGVKAPDAAFSASSGGGAGVVAGGDAVTRSSQVLTSLKALQDSARATARASVSAVPNGLVTGGLEVAPGAAVNTPLWNGAKLPVETNVGAGLSARKVVTVEQTSQQAVLNWKTFNVGSATTLKFDQSAGGDGNRRWVAFNKVSDPSQSPSQILGKIEAPGQVYVINQNGIIFGGGSQVNTHTLVASSLPINDNLVSSGLLNNPDFQFLFSSLKVEQLSGSTVPAFDPVRSLLADGHSGDVVVERGAQISAPTGADSVGGRVALIGPVVTNRGTISTPDGQTILAAGEQVGFVGHASTDPSLRGLDVFVGKVVDPLAAAGTAGGTVTNEGVIEAPRGNVTMVGSTLEQAGALLSTTSVSLNGRLDLRAEYNATRVTDPLTQKVGVAFTATGHVHLAKESLTQVVPEWESAKTVVGTQLALNSAVVLQGHSVHVDENALLWAPSADLTVNAGSWQAVPGGYQLVFDGGQIYVDQGATIDLSGSRDVRIPVARNLVAVQLRGSELADSPLQRSGVLRGKTVTVDMRESGVYNGVAWVGTPLANASGYVGLVERGVGELMTAGGRAVFNAGEAVVVREGARIDVSGGWIQYEGGMMATTRLVSNGVVYDIAKATPERVYDGILTPSLVLKDARHGVQESFSRSLLSTGGYYEAGYQQGAAGGVLRISAGSAALDGVLVGTTVSGPRQRSAAPTPGLLEVSFSAQQRFGSGFVSYSPAAPKVRFETGAIQVEPAAFALGVGGEPDALRQERKDDAVFAPGVLGTLGFGSLKLENVDGDVSVPAGVVLAAAPGGQLSLAGKNITVGGQLSAPGGRLQLSAFNISPSLAAKLTAAPEGMSTPPVSVGRGKVTVADGAVLSVAGLQVDERSGSEAVRTSSLAIHGGTLSLNALDLELAHGALLDVSGGVRVSALRRITYGRAGALNLKAGQDLSLTSVLGGGLQLGAELRGYSGGTSAGVVSVQAPLIRVGGVAGSGLALNPASFSEQGFGSISLVGIGTSGGGTFNFGPGLVIASGTIVAPQVHSWVGVGSLSEDEIQLVAGLKPVGVRAPAVLSFGALNVVDSFQNNLLLLRGDLVMEKGARISTDPLGGVTLKADTLAVDGTILVPGGSISLQAARNSLPLFANRAQALCTLHLGPDASLSAAGTTLIVPDARGNRVGSVLGGGQVTLSGNIVTQAGGRIDVSGTSGVVDVAPSALSVAGSAAEAAGGMDLVAARLSSNGGGITLSGGQMLFPDATLLGAAGGASAQAGSLTVSSGQLPKETEPLSPLDLALVVRQTGSTLQQAFTAGQQLVGLPVRDGSGRALTGGGQFVADRFSQGGFGALALKGGVQFSGAVELRAQRSIAVGETGVLSTDGVLKLEAPYVSLGMAFLAPLSVEQEQERGSLFRNSERNRVLIAPKSGDGDLRVQAQLVDLGHLSLQNIGTASIAAPAGDVRGNGTFDIQGSLTLTAGQVYPTTGARFTISAIDISPTNRGSITVVGGATRSVPLSAGGELALYADAIRQGGVLRAPLGTIQIGWDGSGTAPVDTISGAVVPQARTVVLGAGSVTSVSGVDPRTGLGLLIPYGLNSNNTAWIDPTGTDITAGGVPTKAVTVAGQSVDLGPGSQVDIQGGGDLYAYRFVKGPGGSKDILSSADIFAVLPDLGFDYAPYGAFNPADPSGSLGGDRGYTSSKLALGDVITLGASPGLAAGTYTLLPARYALLPGAFLVTPRSGSATSTGSKADGASIVAGYRFNGLGGAPSGTVLNKPFEVSPGSVVRTRADYRDYTASTFLRDGALANDAVLPRLPNDAGRLLLQATAAMQLRGSVVSTTLSAGRGGAVDISSPVDIFVAGSQANTEGFSGLVLDAGQLSAFGAESLLIGGRRSGASDGSLVTVTTSNLIVDNKGTPLVGADIILAASSTLTMAENSEISGTGLLPQGAEVLRVGDAASAGSGDGVLVRVSASADAVFERSGVSATAASGIIAQIDAGAHLAGGSVTVDSSAGAVFASSVRFDTAAVGLSAFQISLQLDSGAASSGGLVLERQVLDVLTQARSLSLLSYSSIDLCGAGQLGSRSLERLSLQAGSVRGIGLSGGEVTIAAGELSLGNRAAGTALTSAGSLSGSLVVDAGLLRLGSNTVGIDLMSSVQLGSEGGVVIEGTGALVSQGAMRLVAPVVTGTNGVAYSLQAGGAFELSAGAGTGSGTGSGPVPGLGVGLAVQGTSVTVDSVVRLPGGQLSLKATSGNVAMRGNAKLDVAGVTRSFFDAERSIRGGGVVLQADAGSVQLAPGSVLDVSGGGAAAAGSLSVVTILGQFDFGGTLKAQGGGSFSLDTHDLGRTAGLDLVLDGAGFTTSRVLRVRTGDVQLDSVAAKSRVYDLAADTGALRVTGSVDVSGTTGGQIRLSAGGALTLLAGATLDASGQKLDAAGLGGFVLLQTRATSTGIGLLSGSIIRLGVGAGVGGTLQLRAPQTAGVTDVAIAPIAGTVTGSGRVLVEGFHTEDANSASGAFIDDYKSNAIANASAFMANAGGIRTKLLGVGVRGDGLDGSGVLRVRPGEEIVNSSGSLTLKADWDLASLRYGSTRSVVGNSGAALFNALGQAITPGSEPGVLTLRALGSITFNGSLTDGFGIGSGLLADVPKVGFNKLARWKEELLPVFADGSAQESWSYRITSGADFGAADARRVRPLALLGTGTGVSTGSVLVGTYQKTPSASLSTLFQVIRTGTGDIEINAGRDVRLLNQFATIYTAGARSATVAEFETPRLFSEETGLALYPAQYSTGGGSVRIEAQNDILHQTLTNLVETPESQRQLPMNWLYRRGYVDSVTGEFGTAKYGDKASTTWWIDFSNFFEGVGALGGGNVSLLAGRNVSNVDAVVPTNARMPKGKPSEGALVELGGGDLLVRAGRDIDGGVYYVERGKGVLEAGNEIKTNATRSPSLNKLLDTGVDFSEYAPQTWLPTTLFVGKSSFEVRAGRDLLLGPVANPFLLPGGQGNTPWYKTYFSTYSADASVEAASIGGTVTLRNALTLPVSSVGGMLPMLQAWLQNVLVTSGDTATGPAYEALRLNETLATPFSTMSTVMAGTLHATAYSGSISLAGGLTLAPSPKGTLELLAAGSVSGLQVTGFTGGGVTGDTGSTDRFANWGMGTINVSDASPALLPSLTSPYGYQGVAGTGPAATETRLSFLQAIDGLFSETGATQGTKAVLGVQLTLHAAGLLHAEDTEPLRIYAGEGNLSGITLFSPKAARVLAGRDMTDVALYIQNTRDSDVSVVASGRDMVPAAPNSPLRVAAQTTGNLLTTGSLPAAGDLQISGPGVLEVLAGRDLDLGPSVSNGDGTGLGIVSVGNARNPALPLTGSELFVGAGLGPVSGLSQSSIKFDGLRTLLGEPTLAGYLDEVEPDVTVAAFDLLGEGRRAQILMEVFFRVLRDAGRDYGDAASAAYGTYKAGFDAISALFPGDTWHGDLSLTARGIKTQSGGSLNLFAPGGRVLVGLDVAGSNPLDQGILTESGGSISLFTSDGVSVGTSRIFTLRGGDEIIWATRGDIAAGSASKTVAAAPPTRVLIDPQSGDLKTDLAGLATGGGIGVLATVQGLPPGNIDLIAPQGSIDAGDAGIRVSGNLNLAAARILNAENIQVSGSSAGAPSGASAAAPSLGSMGTASSSAVAASNAATEAGKQARGQGNGAGDSPSIVDVEVVGFGGPDEEDAEKKRRVEEAGPSAL